MDYTVNKPFNFYMQPTIDFIKEFYGLNDSISLSDNGEMKEWSKDNIWCMGDRHKVLQPVFPAYGMHKNKITAGEPYKAWGNKDISVAIVKIGANYYSVSVRDETDKNNIHTETAFITPTSDLPLELIPLTNSLTSRLLIDFGLSIKEFSGPSEEREKKEMMGRVFAL
jgi:hypothetical protein